MIVRERSTDRLTDLKTTIVSQKLNLGRRKRIVLGQLQNTVIESTLKLFLQIVKTEIEVVQFSRNHQHRSNRLLRYRLSLFHNPSLGYSFIHLQHLSKL
jgi:hypothetical protein